MTCTRTCDKCGKKIDLEVDTFSIKLYKQNFYKKSFASKPYDLCPECDKAFEDWINTKPE